MEVDIFIWLKRLIQFNPILWLAWFINRVYWCGLNGRTLLGLVLNFAMNFSPMFLWLMIFKNAGLIPKDWRPPIFVKVAVRMNEITFDVHKHPFMAPMCFLLLLILAYVLYRGLYQYHGPQIALPPADDCEKLAGENMSDSIELWRASTSRSNIIMSGNSSTDMSLAPKEEPQKDVPLVLVRSESASASGSESESESGFSSAVAAPDRGLPNCWWLSPLLLLALCWPILNFDMLFVHHQTPLKDIASWASYVPGHAFTAIITAVWLYVFHPPGAVRVFSFMMGLQNIMAVLTHLLFPTAPPWFIHMYGEDHPANYDLEGYAAGLTRVDMQMGTHLHTNGFHKSPIVFGAIPSVHSSMAVMIFYFVGYFSNWTATKLLALTFVAYQWWSTMYLDHHWRIDLLIGMFYALLTYTLFLFSNRYGLQSVVDDFLEARRTHDFARGSTMGMRVFRHTRIRDWFDPLK